MGSVILEIKDLSKTYPDGTQAVKNLTLNINAGEFLSIIGPSGAGKSTLLRSINRLTEPTSGEILFRGQDILKAQGQSLRETRRQIGMIFQHYNLIKRTQTIQNVLHGRLGYMSTFKGAFGVFAKEDIEKGLKLLERVGLKDQAFKRADELSGGQQQRVGIARAIAQEPAIILADEPIASLDPSASEVVMDYLKKVCDEDGIATVVNLHQVDFAKKYATRIVGMKMGEIIFDGPPQDLNEEIIQELYYHKEGA